MKFSECENLKKKTKF
ncbi:hypothetical protein A2U01_0097879, partial [Trifolium medium]|nr:hypothetical protein [Trifolium medium]